MAGKGENVLLLRFGHYTNICLIRRARYAVWKVVERYTEKCTIVKNKVNVSLKHNKSRTLARLLLIATI